MVIGIGYPTFATLLPVLREGLPESVELLAAASGEKLPRRDEIEGLIGDAWFPTPELMPRLRWIHLFNAGFEHVPPRVFDTGWQVTHGGGPAAVPIAEWVVVSMLFFAHRIRDVLRYEAGRSWTANRVAEMTSSLLRGARVGIIGYGAIGREVARLCKAFGMHLIATVGRSRRAQRPTYRTPGTGDPNGELPDEWFERDRLRDVLPSMDYVVLGLRAGPDTRHILDREALARCKPGAIIINPARGALIDEAALIAALVEGRIGGAALDVFEHEPLPPDDPLRDAPNTLISPHCAPESTLFRQEVVRCARENLLRFAEGRPLLGVIDRQVWEEAP